MSKLFVLLFLATLFNSSRAFESWEHKQLSDLAYHIASNVYYCGEINNCPRRENIGFADPVTKEQGDNITYGDVVKCVDYYLTPEKLISSRDNNLTSKINSAEVFNSLIPFDQETLGLDFKKRCRNSVIFNGNQQFSSHANHSHFQAELFLSRKVYHSLALLESNEEYSDFKSDERPKKSIDPIFGALVINAISDHYLQDIFAPGHIVTWRSKLTDVVANAYHDKINRKGLKIDINKEWITRKLGSLPTNYGKPFPFFEKLEQALLNDDRVIAYFYSAYCRDNAPDGSCRPPLQLNISDFAVRSKNILEELAITPSYKKEKTSMVADKLEITVRGDDLLWNKDQDMQRMIMLLTQIRSIVDIFDSANHPPRDSFREKETNTWAWVEPNKGKSEYTKQDRASPDSTITATFGPVSYKIPIILDASNFDSENIIGYPNTVVTGDLNYVEPIIGVSFGNETMAFGNRQNRPSISFEMVLGGDTSLEREAWNSFALFGIHSFYESGSWRPGFGFRYGWMLPDTETSFSIPIRIQQHEAAKNGSVWRPSIGLRIDQGFSSFISLYLQATYDYGLQPDRTLKSGLSFGAGVEIAAPICRVPIPFIKYLGGCY